MNPYDPSNPNEPADRPPAIDGRRLVYRFLSLPFRIQRAILLGIGVPEGEGPRGDDFGPAFYAIRERGLIGRFDGAVAAEWAKRGRS